MGSKPHLTETSIKKGRKRTQKANVKHTQLAAAFVCTMVLVVWFWGISTAPSTGSLFV